MIAWISNETSVYIRVVASTYKTVIRPGNAIRVPCEEEFVRLYYGKDPIVFVSSLYPLHFTGENGCPFSLEVEEAVGDTKALVIKD